MPRKKQKLKQERWVPSQLDKDRVEFLCKSARGSLKALENNVKRGSILSDLDYGDAFKAIEELYTACGIGELAADNAERREQEQEDLKRKGLTS